MRNDTGTFVKIFQDIAARHSAHRAWSDFVYLSAVGFSNAADKLNCNSRGKSYARIANTYTKEDLDGFAAMLEIVISELTRNPDQDFLGSMFMLLELSNHFAGQFFTPCSACQLMSEMSVNRAIEAIEETGCVSISDPACGAGATLIAIVNHLRSKIEGMSNPKKWSDCILCVAEDTDMTVGLMCYIQLSILGCPALVKIGESIAHPMCREDDISDYWFTPAFFSSPHTSKIFK